MPGYRALQLGPALRHPLLQQLFSPPADVSEPPAISSAAVLNALRAVLLQNLNSRQLGDQVLQVGCTA